MDKYEIRMREISKILISLKRIIEEAFPDDILDNMIKDMIKTNGGKSPDEEFNKLIKEVAMEKDDDNLEMDKVLEYYERQMKKSDKTD